MSSSDFDPDHKHKASANMVDPLVDILKSSRSFKFHNPQPYPNAAGSASAQFTGLFLRACALHLNVRCDQLRLLVHSDTMSQWCNTEQFACNFLARPHTFARVSCLQVTSPPSTLYWDFGLTQSLLRAKINRGNSYSWCIIQMIVWLLGVGRTLRQNRVGNLLLVYTNTFMIITLIDWSLIAADDDDDVDCVIAGPAEQCLQIIESPNMVQKQEPRA